MSNLVDRKNRTRHNRDVVVESRFPRLKKTPQIDGRCFMPPEAGKVQFGVKQALAESQYKLVVVDGRIEKLSVQGKEHQEAMRAHDKIVELCRHVDESRFELAEVLCEVAQKHHYRLIGPGYSTFYEYIEKEHALTDRTARYLVQCWKYYAIENKDCPRILQGAKSMGWTKAKELVDIVTPENMEHWFFFCQTSTVKELMTAVKEHWKQNPPLRKDEDEQDADSRITRPARGRFGRQVSTVVRRVSEEEAVEEDVCGAGMSLADLLGEDPFEDEKRQLSEAENAPILELRSMPRPPESTEAMLRRAKQIHGDWTQMVFDVPTEDRALVAQAIKAAQEHSKTENRGVALVHVCTHFASEFSTDYGEYITDWLAAIERVTGLRIAAVDTKKREIVYGEEFLQREAAAS